MQTAEFQHALETLIQMSREKRTAIMCAEAVPWRCHRSLVADALSVHGVPWWRFFPRPTIGCISSRISHASRGRCSPTRPIKKRHSDMQETLTQLLEDIRSCTHCADHLPCGPRPVLQAGRSAQLRIIGQAPGRKVHDTGIPWDDPSGDRLRNWLGLTALSSMTRRRSPFPDGFLLSRQGRLRR